MSSYNYNLACAFRFAGMRCEKDADIYLTPNRAYSPAIGRWLQPDPLGTLPNPKQGNDFSPLSQYTDGKNLYEYCTGDPVNERDVWGLVLTGFPTVDFAPEPISFYGPPCNTTPRGGKCGPDVTQAIGVIRDELVKTFNEESPLQIKMRCTKSYHPQLGWDIEHFYDGTDYFIGNSVNAGTCQCQGTVWFEGKCYGASELNYYLWGLGRMLCGSTEKQAIDKAEFWKKYRYGHLLSVETEGAIRAGFAGSSIIRSCHIGCSKPSTRINELTFHLGEW
ncbi:MAG: RHS repeat-associated core domain-containing protein [Phycisphaerae bacterium]